MAGTSPIFRLTSEDEAGMRLGGLAILILCALAAPAGAAESELGKVTIPLIEPGKPDAGDSAVTGYLFQPTGKGPFPAVVLMHGCNGLDWALPRHPGWFLLEGYAKRYVAQGYVALILDSFAPRGVANACGDPSRVRPVRRAWDALSAARWLGALPSVDKERLVLQGDSHGGSTLLVTLEAGRWRLPEHFAAGIAFYPGCYRTRAGFTAPILILIGDADDWTHADDCSAMAESLRRSGGPELVLKIFPGATHAFDFPLAPRTNALGHHMAYDPAATTASWQAIDAFLAKHVK
jgi:dienelactone hydrolase